MAVLRKKFKEKKEVQRMKVIENLLLKSTTLPADAGHNPRKPNWFQKDLFDRGVKFMDSYYVSVLFSYLLGLILALSYERTLRMLIYTEKSNTPFTAGKRYFSTVKHIFNWTRLKKWNTRDESFRDIANIRRIHMNIFTKINSDPNYVSRNTELVNRFHSDNLTLHRALVKDMKRFSKKEFPQKNLKLNFVTQYDMLLTQYAFVTFVVRHASAVGLNRANEEDLKGFIHFWRVMGWLLGIQDEFNLCNGTLTECNLKCFFIEKRIVLPLLSKVSKSFEYMNNAFIKGFNQFIPGLRFSSLLLYIISNCLKVKLTETKKQITILHQFYYYQLLFVFRVAIYLPFIGRILKLLVKTRLKRAYYFYDLSYF